MKYYCPILFLLCTSLTFAWINPAAPKKQNFATRLGATTADDDEVLPLAQQTVSTSSRRQWFSQVAAAAAALSTPSVAQASTVAAPAKPPSRAVCDTAVTVWKNPTNNRKIFILGTAHISDQSADVAGKLVRDVRPDAVFVELDAKRVGRAGFSTIAPPENSSDRLLATAPAAATQQRQEEEGAPVASQEQPRSSSLIPKLDLKERALQAGSAAVGGAIKGVYGKLNSSGFNAGAEFVMAVQEGRKIGSSIVLGDRDVEVTLRRLTEALSQTDLSALMNPDSELEKSMNELLPGKPPSPDMKDDEFRQEMSSYVETMKAKQNVRKIMLELKKAAPAIYTALVEERDIYMGTGLDSINQFPTTVAVMGIAHMEGVENTLQRLGWQEAPVRCP